VTISSIKANHINIVIEVLPVVNKKASKIKLVLDKLAKDIHCKLNDDDKDTIKAWNVSPEKINPKDPHKAAKVIVFIVMKYFESIDSTLSGRL
jgi:hypothetical protein